MNEPAITTGQAAGAAVGSWLLALITWATPAAAIVFLAFAGSAAGLVVQPPKASRARMFGLQVAYTVFGAAGAVVLGRFLPVLAEITPAVACVLAFFAQVLIPATRDRLSREVRDRDAPADNGGSAP